MSNDRRARIANTEGPESNITYWVEISLGIDWSNETSPETQRWDNECEPARLSASQYTRAKNVHVGDILLHYVNGVHCWAGYSHVVAPPTQTLNPQTEEDKAYPYSMRIKQGKWLNSPHECFTTRTIPGLSHYNWHRKGYVRVKPTDAALIMKAVNDTSGKKIATADNAFLEKWEVLRDANASNLCKRIAGYQCELCKQKDHSSGTLQSWCERLSIEPSTLRKSDTALGWFVHAHHIKPVSDKGNAGLNNLLCVCPNCHRMVQRLDEDGLRKLLRERQIRKD